MDDEGAGSILGFVAGGTIFLFVVAILLGVVFRQVPPPSAAESIDSGNGFQASNLLDRFVRGDGTQADPDTGLGGAYDSSGWVVDSAHPTLVPGLSADGGSGFLNRSKVSDLYLSYVDGDAGTCPPTTSTDDNGLAPAWDPTCSTASGSSKNHGYYVAPDGSCVKKNGKPCPQNKPHAVTKNTHNGLLIYADAHAALGLANDLQFHVEFRTGDDTDPNRCAPVYFGPPLPVGPALEPASARFVMDGDASKACNEGDTVEVRLYVFKGSAA